MRSKHPLGERIGEQVVGPEGCCMKDTAGVVKQLEELSYDWSAGMWGEGLAISV